MTSESFAIRTPAEYFDRVLLPNYREFESSPSDIRLVMNLAVSCLSLRDWMLVAFKDSAPERIGGARTKGDYQQHLNAKEPLYAEVCAIANASKHLELEHGSRVGFRANEVQVEFLRVGDPVGLPLRPIKTRLASGKLVTVNWMLGRVVAMWATELGVTEVGI